MHVQNLPQYQPAHAIPETRNSIISALKKSIVITAVSALTTGVSLALCMFQPSKTSASMALASGAFTAISTVHSRFLASSLNQVGVSDDPVDMRTAVHQWWPIDEGDRPADYA